MHICGEGKPSCLPFELLDIFLQCIQYNYVQVSEAWTPLLLIVGTTGKLYLTAFSQP